MATTYELKILVYRVFKTQNKDQGNFISKFINRK